MILGFEQELPDGRPSAFIDKIWFGLYDRFFTTMSDLLHPYYEVEYYKRFGCFWDSVNFSGEVHAKIHTLRVDRHCRWHEGMDIHMAVNVRTKDYFQFAPLQRCTGVNEVKLVRTGVAKDEVGIFVSGMWLDDDKRLQFVHNDGFDSLEDFEAFFLPGMGEVLNMRLINWTDFKY